MKHTIITISSLLGLMAFGTTNALAVTTAPSTAATPATTSPSNTAVSSTGATTKASSAATTAAAAQAQRLTNLQTDGEAQIESRLTNLTKLTTIITSAKHMTVADKTTLTSEVTTELSGLTALQTRLKGETTVTPALADVQSIFTEFRVYALIDPKVRLIKAADDQQTIETTLKGLSTKLQARITKDKNAGKDVASMQTTLDSMKTEITSTQAMSSDVETKVVALQPSDYNTDHTILKQYDTELKTAHADCHVAHKDGLTVINDLKSLK